MVTYSRAALTKQDSLILEKEDWAPTAEMTLFLWKLCTYCIQELHINKYDDDGSFRMLHFFVFAD